VGAVSGTALSFELGLLWPRFMEAAGDHVGPAFVLEGYAFFIEAIFVGLYLYGWERLSPRAHFLCGIPVALSGVASGALVVAVNAWMQLPVYEDDALAPFRSPVYPAMALHSTLSCYIAVGFAVAGVYSFAMLRDRGSAEGAYRRAGMDIALAVAALAAVAQLVSGDASAKAVAQHEPVKLAAMEAHFETRAGAPLLVGGVPDEAKREVKYGIFVPKGLSFLAFGDTNAEVRGLSAFPADERPNVLLSHFAFQTMVGSGGALVVAGIVYWSWRWRRRRGPKEAPIPRWLAGMFVAVAPLGFVALEAGWVVTEAGRQPWIIHGVMRTRDALTPAQGVNASFVGFTVLYLALGVVVILLLRFFARKKPKEAA
jgi:cytochrome d ubiquinol oxidase subunit I